MKRIIPTVCFSLLLMSCMPFLHSNTSHDNERAMSKGMTISVKSKMGNLSIEALDDLTRKLYWDGRTKQVKMDYRNERWFGKYGAYSPGGRSDVHVVIEEGQQHFCSQQEAEEWLLFQDPKMNYIFTKDGLAIGWYKEYNKKKDGFPDVLLVDIVHIYILDKKPTDLSNAQDSLFTITYSNDYVDNVKIGQNRPSVPKIIGQRMYSGMSIDIMEERGITTEQVERCIANGNILKEGAILKYLKNGGYTEYIHTSRWGDVVWAIIDKDNRVVLVGE